MLEKKYSIYFHIITDLAQRLDDIIYSLHGVLLSWGFISFPR